jgi:Tfp pilus assembly protein PilO
MRQFIAPIVLFVTAIGLFVLYTNPTYQHAKSVKIEVASYDDALDKSQELRKVRDEKVTTYNTFTQEEKDKLTRILPDNVDNIHLIIDINNVAARRGLSLKNVTLGVISDSATTRSATAVGASGSAVGSVSLGFSVSATYEDMLLFLADLEHSLRVMDTEKLSFTVSSDKKTASGPIDYSISVRTYWLH